MSRQVSGAKWPRMMYKVNQNNIMQVCTTMQSIRNIVDKIRDHILITDIFLQLAVGRGAWGEREGVIMVCCMLYVELYEIMWFLTSSSSFHSPQPLFIVLGGVPSLQGVLRFGACWYMCVCI
jgi:hypothetical protein